MVRKKVYKWLFRYAVVFALNLSLCLTPFFSMKAYAMEENQLKKSVEEATSLLESVLKKQYEEKEQEIKSIVMEKGYHYDMTMTSFYDNGNPFKDLDYISILSVYSTIREHHSGGHGMLLGNVPFLNMEVVEKSYQATRDKLYPVYEAVPEGYFVRKGNQVISEDTEMEKYEEFEPGKYRFCGTEMVSVDTQTVVYGEVTLTVIQPEDLFEIFSVDEKQLSQACEKRKAAIESIVNENALSQSVFVQTRHSVSEVCSLSAEDISRLITQAPADKQNLLMTAVSLIGQVPYQWGGKAKGAGYDNNWWLYENGVQKGMDCSGFVQWAFMTAGLDNSITDKMVSTSEMLSGLEDVSESELQPGDIGILNQGESVNHTGIYLGEGYYIHCSSAVGTVTISNFDFHYFKKASLKNSVIDNEGNKDYSVNNYTKSVEYEKIHQEKEKDIQKKDVRLLAQLIEHEAGNQGFNGWVAVGEVVLNRMNSPAFPNTVEDVIYERGQFTKSEELRGIEPRKEILAVAEDVLLGNLKIFNEPTVLFFKNPRITDGIAAESQVDWGIHKWYASVNEHAFYTM